jgi:hypothetical protein
MSMLTVPLTDEESTWLEDWSTLSGYQTPADGIKEVLKVCGAIPKGHEYWKKKFSFAED